MSALYDLRQEHAANGLIAGISRFWVLLALRNFCIGARDCRTTTKAQTRRVATNAFDVEENRLCANGADAVHLANPGMCGGILNGQQTDTLDMSDI
jgi:hypothetical protein